MTEICIVAAFLTENKYTNKW